jgi:hypothetical protein
VLINSFFTQNKISMLKKILVFLVFVISFSKINAQFESNKQIYVGGGLSELVSTAKTVAILPFKAKISYKRMPKGTTVESVKEEEKALTTTMQQGMLTYLLRKSDDYTVKFQDVDRTNALLKKAGVYEDIDAVLADSLCKILGVDAVIKSTWTYEKTGSEAGAIVMALAVGVNKNVGSGGLTLQIYGAKDGELAWRFYKEMNESAWSNANEMMERIMRKIGRNFPFEKK